MKRQLFLFHLIAATQLLSALSLYAQDPMTWWKPSVGDKFVYAIVSTSTDYWHGSPTFVSSARDTMTVTILNIDSAYSPSYQHVVTTWNTFTNPQRSPYTMLFYFHPGANPFSAHPFAIDMAETLCDTCEKTRYDFSTAKTDTIQYHSDRLPVFSAIRDSVIPQTSSSPGGTSTYAAQYSPNFKWIFSQSSSDDEPPPNYTYTGFSSSTTLISATTSKSNVPSQHTLAKGQFEIYQSGNLLMVALHSEDAKPISISLLDPLARPIRLWQMSTYGDESRISLNIADIPSGVYFIKIEAAATGVNKIAILK